MLYRMYIYLLSEGDHDEYSRECVKQLSKIIGEPLAAGGDYPHRIIMFEVCGHLLKKHGDEKAIYNIASYFACKLCTDLDSFVINAKDSRGIESKYSLLHCYQAQALLDPLRSSGDDNFADIFAIKYSLAEKPQSVTSNVYGRKFYITGHFARVTLDAGDYIKAAFNGVISVDFMYKMFFEKKYKYYYTEETFLGKALDYVSLVYAGIREYNAPVCTKSRRSVLAANYLKSFIGKNAPKEYTDTDKKLIGFTEKIYDTLIEEVVGTELKRGDTETKYTADIGKLNRIYGADKLAAILSALGSETLDRRSYYTKKTKKESLSHLLAVCLPLPEDNADTLRKAAEGTDITEKRLIEAAMYSPEWLPIVGEYLGWEGFTSACYYFIAHMNERFDDKRKAVIAKYTPLTDEELNEGVFDIRQYRTKQAIENQEEKWYNIVMNKQLTFSLISDELAHAKTSKKEFLEKIERIIPFDEWIGIIRPCYYKGEHGNKPYDLELMLRIFLLQNLYDLSDMKVMNEVIDSRAFSDFCGVDSPNQVPDGDTIGRFRNILVENGLQEKLFHQVIDILSEKGLILKRGTIVDSTLIAAPSSTKNKDKKRDKDAHSVKKGNQWHFGYKAHIGVDKDSGLVHHLKVTGANEHDVTATPDLMHGEEEELYGDSGYIGAEKRENAVVKNKNGRKIKYKINRKPSTMKKLSKSGQYAAKKAEHKKSSVRAKVEHVFAVVKRLFGYRKTRYRGLRKQTAKLNIMFALANLYLADRKSLTA